MYKNILKEETKMVCIQNDCCDCAGGGYSCLGNSCPLRHAKHYYCDDCKDEVDELYRYGDEELCIDCIEKRLERVE